jgi:hypothetical protein
MVKLSIGKFIAVGFGMIVILIIVGYTGFTVGD